MEFTYPFVIAAGRAAFRALGLRIDIEGTEHIPRSGPVVLASNHVSFLDFLLVGVAGIERDRRVRFLARHDLWRAPVVGSALTAMRHVPVDRQAPAAAYLRARSLLRDGEAVGVFPEAGVSTSYTVRSLMPGAVALARETGAPLVPVTLWGPQRILTAKQPRDLSRGRPVSILVGEPLDVPGDVVRGTRHLGARLQGMLDTLQRRDLHRPEPGSDARWHPAHLGGSAPTPAQARLAEALPRSAVAPPFELPPRRGAFPGGAAAADDERGDQDHAEDGHPLPGLEPLDQPGER